MNPQIRLSLQKRFYHRKIAELRDRVGYLEDLLAGEIVDDDSMISKLDDRTSYMEDVFEEVRILDVEMGITVRKVIALEEAIAGIWNRIDEVEKEGIDNGMDRK